MIETVLLIDDSPEMLRSLARLVRTKYDVFAAHNTFEAMKICGSNRIDAVVSDYDIGDVNSNGGHLLATIKQLYPAMRRVLLTGNPNPKAEAADAILAKPATIVDLVAAIEGGS